MHQYLSAKHMRRKERLYQNTLIPLDNVLHLYGVDAILQ